MPPHVTLATCESLPALSDDDATLLPALARLGVDADARVWSDPGQWRRPADLVVVRSCWDYHRRLPAFEAWLGTLEGAGVRVLNPPGVLRWNARKRYLLDLAERGVPGIPTTLVEADAWPALLDALDALRARDPAAWGDVVVKPEVSASAEGARRLRTAGERAALRAAPPPGSRVLVQPYVREIETLGEASLAFVAGAFSHAVLKRPARGDFRVQTEHGGSVSPLSPPAALVETARGALDAAAAACGVAAAELLYARVDLCPTPTPRLMELELIEPDLFLRSAPGAADALARAIVAALGRSG